MVSNLLYFIKSYAINSWVVPWLRHISFCLPHKN